MNQQVAELFFVGALDGACQLSFFQIDDLQGALVRVFAETDRLIEAVALEDAVARERAFEADLSYLVGVFLDVDLSNPIGTHDDRIAVVQSGEIDIVAARETPLLNSAADFLRVLPGVRQTTNLPS